MVSHWLSVCPFIRLSVVSPSVCQYFHFRMITGVNVNGLSPILVCVLILWRSGLGLLMAKLCQFLTELSARNMSLVSFPYNNLSKYQWIFTKLGKYIDIVEIWFGIAHGQIWSISDRVTCLQHVCIFISGI